MRTILLTLLAVSLSYFALSHLTNFRSYRDLPPGDLKNEQVSVSVDIGQLASKESLQESEKKHLLLLKGERAKIEAEIFIRDFYFDQVMVVVFIVSLLGSAAFFLRPSGSRRDTSLKANLGRDFKVQIGNPKEEYIDEWEVEQRTRDGFKTKAEAIKWLQSDPMLDCDYCGASLRSQFGSDRETVYLTTFYKRVPAGATDLRVVLGSFWFAEHARELKCERCGKVIIR